MRVKLVNGVLRLEEASLNVASEEGEAEAKAAEGEEESEGEMSLSLSPTLKRRRADQASHDLADARRWGLDDRFDFQAPLGRGSFGAVWLARCRATEDRVAVKRVGGIYRDVGTAKRVLRELWILRRCDHLNVIGLRDVLATAEPSESLCFVLEACDSDLQKLFQRGVRLALAQVQALVAQLFNGLRYLHDMRVLHRDLKPANVLVNRGLGLRICDFGLARIVAGPPAREGTPGSSRGSSPAPTPMATAGSAARGAAEASAADATRTAAPEVRTSAKASPTRPGARKVLRRRARPASPNTQGGSPDKAAKAAAPRRFRPKKRARGAVSAAPSSGAKATISAGPTAPEDLAPTDLTPESGCRGLHVEVPAKRSRAADEARVEVAEEEDSPPARPPGMLRSMTCTNIVTKWYRAPEIALEQPVYDYAVDVWSAGCILVEMLQCLDAPRPSPQQLSPQLSPPSGRTSPTPRGRPDYDACFDASGSTAHAVWRPMPLFRTQLADAAELPQAGHSAFSISGENFAHLTAILAILRGPRCGARTLEASFPHPASATIATASAAAAGAGLPGPGLRAHLEVLAPRAPREALSLAAACLAFLPRRRITAREAATRSIVGPTMPTAGPEVPMFQTPGVLAPAQRSPNGLEEPNPQRASLLVNMGEGPRPGVLTRSQSHIRSKKRLLDPVERVVQRRLARVVQVLAGHAGSVEHLALEELRAMLPAGVAGPGMGRLCVEDVRDAVEAEMEEMRKARDRADPGREEGLDDESDGASRAAAPS